MEVGRGKTSFPRKTADQDLNPGLDAELLLLTVIRVFITYLFLNFFLTSLSYVIHHSFFKLSQISKKFSSAFTEKNPHISRPVQSKPTLFGARLS